MFIENIYNMKLLKSGFSGGARRDRTDDLKLAKLPLSQLSYGPSLGNTTPKPVVGLGRLERPTSPLSGVRSNHLSYRPISWSRSKSILLIPHNPVKKEKRRRQNSACFGNLTGFHVL
jgi:hypothetical protein